jgi:hypothetical protein
MKKRTFYFQGTAQQMGSFGWLITGQEVIVDDGPLAVAMENDTATWFERPTGLQSPSFDEGNVVKTPTTGSTILTTDRLIRSNLSVGNIHNLPAAPAAKQVVEVVDIAGNAAAQNVTIGRNGKLIDGAAANVVINTNGGRARFFYDGANWRTF